MELLNLKWTFLMMRKSIEKTKIDQQDIYPTLKPIGGLKKKHIKTVERKFKKLKIKNS
jgi:hypothetical protein